MLLVLLFVLLPDLDKGDVEVPLAGEFAVDGGFRLHLLETLAEHLGALTDVVVVGGDEPGELLVEELDVHPTDFEAEVDAGGSQDALLEKSVGFLHQTQLQEIHAKNL